MPFGPLMEEHRSCRWPCRLFLERGTDTSLETTVANTSSLPCPHVLLGTAPVKPSLKAFPMMAIFTSAAVANGHFWRYSATAPLTTGDAMEVPPFRMCIPPGATLCGSFVTKLASVFRGPALKVMSPVAATSGFSRPSRVGPMLERGTMSPSVPGTVCGFPFTSM